MIYFHFSGRSLSERKISVPLLCGKGADVECRRDGMLFLLQGRVSGGKYKGKSREHGREKRASKISA